LKIPLTGFADMLDAMFEKSPRSLYLKVLLALLLGCAPAFAGSLPLQELHCQRRWPKNRIVVHHNTISSADRLCGEMKQQ
jgi:hypothetical protein